MSNEILFRETQKFNQRWLWIVLVLADAVLLATIIIVIGSQGFDDGLTPVIVLSCSSLFIVLLPILFKMLRLETEVRRDGLYVKFFPFHSSFREYSWDTISKIFIREYSPLGEYGGWGIRVGASGRAFNVSGNKGLQLEFNDGKRLLIGTNKPEQLTEELKKLGQLKQ